MVEALSIVCYRKLKDIDINFCSNLNFISGTNGTCKTSLLHMTSNSYQLAKKTNLKDENCLRIINQINDRLNPKIESLTKGDRKNNDPAPNVKGTLYKSSYWDKSKLDFRRHNSKLNERYAIKPYYPAKSTQRLPELPVIYLGLGRLVSYGEIDDTHLVKKVSSQLPEDSINKIKKMYKELTGIEIDLLEKTNNIDGVKKRANFTTKSEGIDSNTISAGEDNLLIILTAIESLAYYYSSLITTEKRVESILLIDEVDATLHPSLQVKLMDKLEKYSSDYKIQVICTTHSLSLLEEASKHQHNIVYLVDNEDKVDLLVDSKNIEAIKMHLNNETIFSYVSPKIPIFTEDNEARDFLKELLIYKEQADDSFKKVTSSFHYVEANISANNLKNIFEDSILLRTTMKSICILDGDQNECITNCIVSLPGKSSPEELVFNYLNELYQEDNSDFWMGHANLGISKSNYRSGILNEINGIEKHISELKQENKSTKGIRRQMNKSVYSKHKNFFIFVIKYWIEHHEKEVNEFFSSLQKVYYKVAEFNNVNKNIWTSE
jgi:predicted ATPase